jgi:hypothetical protein
VDSRVKAQDYGEVTKVPGNRYDDFRHALDILKHAEEIKDPEFKKAAIKAASDYCKRNFRERGRRGGY